MTKEWTFEQELEPTQTSSAEEREKIAALFGRTTPTTEIDYGAAFKKQKETPEMNTATPEETSPLPKSTVEVPNDITASYQSHLKRLMADNDSDIQLSQKKIEEMHSLIDKKNKENKQLQSIYDAISELE